MEADGSFVARVMDPVSILFQSIRRSFTAEGQASAHHRDDLYSAH